MAEYYNDRSLLAGVSAPQINVGDITKAGSIVAQSLKSQRDKEIENARLDREAQKFGWEQNRFERENLINQRQDKEYDRQQNALQASKDIARELIDTPYAAKFGGAENMEKVDADVQAAVQKRALTPAEDVRLKSILEKKDQGGMLTTDEEGLVDKAKKSAFTPEEAAGIQKTYEANMPFKEDAQKHIIARMRMAGATGAEAAAEAEGLTRGLISRADRQKMLDQQRDDKQKYYDKLADSRVEVYKALTSNDLERAKMLMNTMGSGGTGSGAKGGGIGFGTSWDDVMSKDHNLSPYGFGWIGDDAKVRDLAIAARKDNYSPWAFQKAIENATTREGSGDYIDDASFKKYLTTYQATENRIKAGQSGDSAKAAGIDVSSLLDRQYVPQQVAGYTPDRMESLLQQNAPTVFGGNASSSEQTGNQGVGGVDASKTVKGKIHIDGIPDSLLANEGATVNKDGMYTISPDVDSKGVNRGRVIGYGYNLEQNKDNIKSDFQKAGIPDYKAKEALDPNGNFTLSKDENDKLAKVVYGREGVDKATKVVPGYKELTPMMKEIANDMAYRGDLKPGENSYRGELPKLLSTGDINQVYKYVNEMNVPQEVKTRLGNILTTERSREEVLGIKNNGSVLAQPQHDLIKQGRLNEVILGMKRQNEREDWSNGESGSELNTPEQIKEFNTGPTYNIPTTNNKAADSLIAKYITNKGQGMFADSDLVVKLQREGKLSEEKAKDILQKLKQELHPISKLGRSFED